MEPMKIPLLHTNIVYYHGAHFIMYTVCSDVRTLRCIFKRKKHILSVEMTIKLIRILDVNSNLGDVVLIFYPSDRLYVNRKINFSGNFENVFFQLALLIEKKSSEFCRLGRKIQKRKFCECDTEEGKEAVPVNVPDELFLYTDVADEFDFEHVGSIIGKSAVCIAYENELEMRNVFGALYYYRKEWPLLILVDNEEQKGQWKELIKKYLFRWECGKHIMHNSHRMNYAMEDFKAFENLLEEIYQFFEVNYEEQEIAHFDEEQLRKDFEEEKGGQKIRFSPINFRAISKKCKTLYRQIDILSIDEYCATGEIYDCVISQVRIYSEVTGDYNLLVRLAQSAAHFVQFYKFSIDPIDEQKLTSILLHLRILTGVALHRKSYFLENTVYVNNSREQNRHFMILDVIDTISYGQIICESNLMPKLFFLFDLINIY